MGACQQLGILADFGAVSWYEPTEPVASSTVATTLDAKCQQCYSTFTGTLLRLELIRFGYDTGSPSAACCSIMGSGFS